jgi:membrane protease YdiL (CAAX protease family)
MLQFPDIAFMAMLDVVVVLKLWVMIYVGWILWERRSGDYWGIRFWTSQRRAIVLTGTVVVAGMIAYSVLLFYLFSPRLGEAVRILGGGDDIHGFEEWLLVSVVVTNFAISEEFIYRGCIQAMLTRWFGDRQAGAWAAIILTAVLWTLMHTGSLEPNWIKYAQVFPLAIFLGWWFSRAGFLGTVSIHVLFNLLMVPLAQQIIHS